MKLETVGRESSPCLMEQIKVNFGICRRSDHDEINFPQAAVNRCEIDLISGSYIVDHYDLELS